MCWGKRQEENTNATNERTSVPARIQNLVRHPQTSTGRDDRVPGLAGELR